MTNKKYKTTKKSKKKEVEKTIVVEGFSLKSHNHKFYIKGEEVSNIVIADQDLINALMKKKVHKRYKKLLEYLTTLLTGEDDDGTSCKMVLNEIEKFRLEIKNKYRKYLEDEELKIMSKQLKLLQKEAKNKAEEMKVDFYDMMMGGKGM